MTMEIKVERHRVTTVIYQRCFEYAPHCGYAFPCDEHGRLLTEGPTYDCWKQNYEDCINGLHPELEDVGVKRYTIGHMEPAVGICEVCGNDVILEGDRYGVCKCDHCDQWYNAFGQAILPPNQWQEPLEPEDYY